MGLHKKGSVIIDGSIKINDGGTVKDVVNLSPDEVRDIRGRAVAMIFQDPMSSLHPYYKIGNQLAEAFEVHHPGNKKAAKARAIEMLDLVGISEPAQRAEEFPHQFSGGMRQRVMIAMALMNSPRLLIADEPTTALDVTVQAQILSLLDKLKKEFDMGVLLITHDLGVVAQVADRVSVMYAGQIVEEAPVDDLFYTPKAPYTVGLLKSVPRISAKNERLKAIPGQPPSLIHLPQGCDFSARCEYRNLSPVDCAVVPVSLHTDSAGHSSRCHIPIEVRNSVFAKDLQELK
jgi:peptide/nickel transport system ATP-binding protein